MSLKKAFGYSALSIVWLLTLILAFSVTTLFNAPIAFILLLSTAVVTTTLFFVDNADITPSDTWREWLMGVGVAYTGFAMAMTTLVLLSSGYDGLQAEISTVLPAAISLLTVVLLASRRIAQGDGPFLSARNVITSGALTVIWLMAGVGVLGYGAYGIGFLFLAMGGLATLITLNERLTLSVSVANHDVQSNGKKRKRTLDAESDKLRQLLDMMDVDDRAAFKQALKHRLTDDDAVIGADGELTPDIDPARNGHY